MAKHAFPVDERIVSTSPILDTSGAESGLEAINQGVPTQVANPSRASWRTFAQAVIAFLVVANVALPIVQQFLVDNIADAQTVLGPIYGFVVLVVNIAVIVTSLGAKLIALLMARPEVNAWIIKHLQFLAPIPLGNPEQAIVSVEEFIADDKNGE